MSQLRIDPEAPFDDIEILDPRAPQDQADAVQGQPQAEGEAPGPLDAEGAAHALREAEVLPPQNRPLAARLRETCTYTHSDSFLNKLGRGLMRLLHGLFHPFRTLSAPSVKDAEHRLNFGSRVTTLDLREPVNADEPITFSIEELGLAMGLRGEVELKTFGNGKLYPNGLPSMQDIKQDPSLQDCWFLSSLNAALASQGAHAIMRLITEQPTAYHVQLGDKIYAVPKGDITDAHGTRGVRGGAQWVRVMETAMQMHLLHNATAGGGNLHARDMNMAFRSPAEGLQALAACGISGWDNAQGQERAEADAAIRQALVEHRPVVLGHNSGAVRDGISPGHAVTVLAARPDGYTILDPYGNTRNVSADILTSSRVYIAVRPLAQ